MYIEKFFKTRLRENSAFIFLFYENLIPLKKKDIKTYNSQTKIHFW